MSIKSLLVSSAVLAAFVGISATGTVAHAASTLPKSTSTTVNDSTGSATGKSDATVKVVSGYLTLDAVPDMNFGQTAQSETAPSEALPLQDNQGIVDDDGNDSGLLKVTDSRPDKTADATAKTMPWQLTAQLGNFTATNSSSTSTAVPTDGWAINLEQKSGSNTQDSMPALAQPALTAGGSARQVLRATDTRGQGSTMVYYNKADSASLTMPANVKAGQYDAPITWTLNATPNDSVN